MNGNEIPQQWVKTTLGHIVDYGRSAKKTLVDVNDNTWVLELEDIEKDSSKLLSKVKASDRKFKSTKNTFHQGDVLYGKLRPYLNKVIMADEDGVCTTEIIPINAEPFCINRYIFFWLKNPIFLRYVREVSYGVNMPRLGTNDGKSAPFYLAPLAEQKIIADKLDDLLARVESIKTRLENIPEILKKFRQSVLSAAVSGKLTEEWRFYNRESISLEEYKTSLGDFKSKAKGLKPIVKKESWLSCQLGHVISVSSGNSLTAKEMKPDSSIPVYGGNGINGYHDQSNITESKVVIGRVGFYCGSVHLTENIAWITDNALIVDFPENILIKNFVFWLLSATNLREDSASTAQPVISGTKIYSIPLQIPPVAEQFEIVHIIETYMTFASRIEHSTQEALNRVNNLTQSILAKAFRGELTAQWREENPELINGLNSAEALLEKITAEKLAAGTIKKRAKKTSH